MKCYLQSEDKLDTRLSALSPIVIETAKNNKYIKLFLDDILHFTRNMNFLQTDIYILKLCTEVSFTTAHRAAVGQHDYAQMSCNFFIS